MYGLYIFDKVGVTSYNNIKINLLEDLIMLVFVNIWQRSYFTEIISVLKLRSKKSSGR